MSKKITIIIEDDDEKQESNQTKPYPPGTITWPAPSSPSIPIQPTIPIQPREYNNGWVDGVNLCESCPNNPKNGGSGVCNCVIPSMYGPMRVTC